MRNGIFGLRGLCLGFLLAVTLAPDASAQYVEKPLYEVEALAWATYAPDYPGAAQSHLHAIGLPWITYRGDVIRTDENARISGRIVQLQRFELDISASGSFPAYSSNNTARAGMPNLDYMGEIGPRARVNFFYWQNQATGAVARMGVELPVRAVLSTNITSRFDYRGITASPEVFFDTNRLFGSETRLKFGAGPIFATRELMSYFYQVDPQYATTDRPAYDAKAGYMGSQAELSVIMPLFDRIKLFGKSSFEYLGGSANADSPLLEKKTNATAIVGMSFSFYQSKDMVRQ